MSLDTKYRPRGYDDVLGQGSILKVLRQFVVQGRGFHQSVLFSGGHGGGKTTLGRIYARALLCEAVLPTGDPCNTCPSCLAILEHGTSESFTEVDAATNSGKDDVRRITEEIQFNTFSGKRRLYLFDESHQLTAGALDALLKPMEENLSGSPEKKLVCIFCTTEPDKMRETILSRCAPAFVLRALTPEVIAGRLEQICQGEGFEYEPEVLPLLAEMTECHVRDAIKALEGVSMLGAINVENVSSYLHLDMHGLYLDILDALGEPGSEHPTTILSAVRTILGRVSPGAGYHRLCEAAILAFQCQLGVANTPRYWDEARMKGLGSAKGARFLAVADRLSRTPSRPSEAMLICDLMALHQQLQGVSLLPTVQSTHVAPLLSPSRPMPSENVVAPGTVAPDEPVTLRNGVSIDQRGVRRVSAPPAPSEDRGSFELDQTEFARIVGKRVAELGRSGST